MGVNIYHRTVLFYICSVFEPLETLKNKDLEQIEQINSQLYTICSFLYIFYSNDENILSSVPSVPISKTVEIPKFLNGTDRTRSAEKKDRPRSRTPEAVRRNHTREDMPSTPKRHYITWGLVCHTNF